MVKQVFNNKGFSVIEMIFVLSIITIMVSLCISRIPDLSQFKFKYLRELLYDAQYDSMSNQKINEIEIFRSTLYINEKEYDLNPLICNHEIFHYNEKGNISNALTILCSCSKEYEYRLQLGSGWISYE